MKVRIISSAIGLVILAIVLFFFETPVYVVAIGIVSAAAVFELLHSTKYVVNRYLLAWSVLFGFIFPTLYTTTIGKYLFYACFIFVAGLCVLLLSFHDTLPFSSFSAAFTIAVLVPNVFAIFILLRNKNPNVGMFYLFLVLAGAWLSDTGAYFAGRAFGKHQLAPKISPKKTVEGFLGGILTATVGFVIIAFIFTKITPLLHGVSLQVNYPILVAIAPLCSVAGVMGDLFASVLKRQTGIKDYGSIMPGHGGVMDRFDSVLFVSPVLYLLVTLLPVAVATAL